MHVEGSCHCGAVRFEAEVLPERVGICHCTDCQVFSSSAFRTSAFVPGDDFRLLAGSPNCYEKTAESGTTRELWFCGQCGTHLWGRAGAADRPTYSVRVGVLAQRAELPPVAQVWCRSALPWLATVTSLRRIETQ